jgi:hypothetical protein
MVPVASVSTTEMKYVKTKHVHGDVLHDINLKKGQVLSFDYAVCSVQYAIETSGGNVGRHDFLSNLARA